MQPKRTSTLRYLAYAGQLGFSLIVPIVACTGGAWWLCQRYQLPQLWILLGIGIGLCGAGCSFLRFARLMQGAAHPNKEEQHANTQQNPNHGA